MAYMNCKQDHNEIKHMLNKNHAMNNTIYQLREKKKTNTRMKLNTYLHEYDLHWENILEIKEIFTSLRSKIFHLQKISS